MMDIDILELEEMVLEGPDYDGDILLIPKDEDYNSFYMSREDAITMARWILKVCPDPLIRQDL